MPMYDTTCACGPKTVLLPFSAYRDGVKCTECGQQLCFVFSPRLSFTTKDGVSGGWPTKVDREKKYRASRRREVTVLSKDSHHSAQLVPNYNGTEVDSWRDAKAEASRDGKNTAGFSRFGV